jgi:hypothetical protein
MVEDATRELEKLVIKAPAAGKVKLLVAPGKPVKAGDTLAEIGGDDAAPSPTLKATFDAGAAVAGYTEGSSCVVAAKGAQDRQFACVVEAIADGKVDVRLVAVSGGATATPGDEVVLLLPETRE